MNGLPSIIFWFISPFSDLRLFTAVMLHCDCIAKWGSNSQVGEKQCGTVGDTGNTAVTTLKLAVFSNILPSCVDCVWNVIAHTQKPDFLFRAKWTSAFKSAGGRQFSRLLAAEVCGISGSNAGYTMFRGSVKGTGYPLHSPVHLNRPVGVSSVDYWQPRCAHRR